MAPTAGRSGGRSVGRPRWCTAGRAAAGGRHAQCVMGRVAPIVRCTRPRAVALACTVAQPKRRCQGGRCVSTSARTVVLAWHPSSLPPQRACSAMGDAAVKPAKCWEAPGRKKVRSDPRRRVGPGAAAAGGGRRRPPEAAGAAGGEPRRPLRNRWQAPNFSSSAFGALKGVKSG
jgi:hypothetical protein